VRLLKESVGALGGARLKVNARDGDGALWIVKLTKMDDQYADGRAEVMALHLAGRVGITPCRAEAPPNAQRFPAAMVKRFDRAARGDRIPFI
jgi:serine/threonine-protein kinase HipA